MSLIKYNVLILILSLNFFILIICQDEDIVKSVACMSLLNEKYKDKEKQINQKTYGSEILNCYITITEVEAKEIVMGLQQGIKTLEKEDIDRLTDISGLKNYTNDEIKEYSQKLNKAITSFQKMQDNYNSGKRDRQNDDVDDEHYKKSHPSRGNFLGSIMKGMTGILKLANNIGTVILIIIFGYFALILFRKYCDNGKRRKETKTKEKDEGKNKKKKKKN